MEKKEFRNERTFGSVKAAINMYGGGKIGQFSNTMKKSQNDASYPEKRTSSKAQELHVAKNRINQIIESTRIAESEISQAEFELMKAKNLVRELTSQIEDSKLRAKEYKRERKGEEQPIQEENDHYKVAREVEAVKRELTKIKLEIQSTVEEKSHAEKEAHGASLKLASYTRTAENLRREIDEVIEEEVLVELAQIQARKELEEIEAQWKEERERFSKVIEETRKKIDNLKDEIEKKKDLEDTLDVTNSDVDVLQSELNLIREMDSKFKENEVKMKSTLELARKELEAARKELEVVKGKGFQIMRSMDVIRKELIKILNEKGELKKKEEETEKDIKKLNSELLKAKDKLEFARESEGKTKSMFDTLSLTLENLAKEKEAAMKEEEDLKEETRNIRAETRKILTETNANEERLQALIEEIERVKISEENALEKLKEVAQNVARTRVSKTKSTITISKFEYDYLKGSAREARELADKKVASAQAWTEALMAEERETKIKIGLAEKKIRELKLKEDEEFRKIEELEKARELAKDDLKKRRQQGEMSLQERRLMRESDYNSTPGRRAKFRRSVGSPATRRMSASTSLTMKRRRKVMLKIAKNFANENIENEKLATNKRC